MSKSKLILAFTINSVSFFHNEACTYFAQKGPNNTRVTRISRDAFDSACAQFGALRFERAKLESKLFDLRYDFDTMGEGEDLWNEISALSDTELKSLIDEYESKAEIEVDLPTPATVDATAPIEAETVPASDPTPATVATVDATPAPIEAAPAPVDPAPVMDGATRPDWAAMQSFERVTLEDVQAVPALVARGLGFAAMGLCKVAAMGIGALMGLGVMGLRKVIAR